MSGTAPAVSVVVPTRDRPELLAQTIASVAGQDYDGPIDCIVVHDGGEPPEDSPSPERAGCTVRHIANAASPGLAGARNTGILAAASPYVAFCDDDDTWLPLKLRRQIDAMEADPELLVTGCANTVVYGSHRTVRTAPGDTVTLDDLLRSRVAVLHSSTIVARRYAILDRIGLVSEDIPGGASEDYEWQLRASRIAPIGMINEPLADITWHAGSRYARQWNLYVAGLSYILEHYPEFDTVRRGKARIYGQIAFGCAAAGDVRGAFRWGRRCLQADMAQPRGYLAMLVSLRLCPPDPLLRALHARGRGI
jgi:glycosyltransferase involved in cell wall biosynthesis